MIAMPRYMSAFSVLTFMDNQYDGHNWRLLLLGPAAPNVLRTVLPNAAVVSDDLIVVAEAEKPLSVFPVKNAAPDKNTFTSNFRNVRGIYFCSWCERDSVRLFRGALVHERPKPCIAVVIPARRAGGPRLGRCHPKLSTTQRSIRPSKDCLAWCLTILVRRLKIPR